MLDSISNRITAIIKRVSGKAVISEKNIGEIVDEIKIALLEADVNLRVVRRFVNSTIEKAKGITVVKSVSPGEQFVKILHDRMVYLFGTENQDLSLKGPDTRSVILFLGLQGSGKTTTAAKIALKLKKNGRKPLLVAADTVRPAAIEQLSILAESIGVEVYEEGIKDPLIIVKNSLKYASKNQYDTILIDTAGRLHIDTDMLHQINQIKKITKADETLLVADAMTGQTAVDIAREFDTNVGITGIVLSKFDSDTRGGAAFSLKTITGKPIKFIGTGEKVEDIELFHPERIASRILGMGDVVTLVEKAQETFDLEEAEKLQKKMEKAAFTLEDYLEQFQKIRKMGSIQSVMDMIPGAAGRGAEVDEGKIKREEAVILSMTLHERRNHRIIGPSRRRRIALGSGTSVFDVNSLLKKFEKTRLMMKKMMKNKKYQAGMLSQLGIQ